MTHDMKEHFACYYCNEVERTLVEILRVDHMETGEILLLQNEIIFILEGKLSFTFRDHTGGEIGKGQLMFLPVGDRLFYRAVDNSLVLVVRMHEMRLCQSFSVEKLYKRIEQHTGNPENLGTLDINNHLWNFANGLVATCSSGLLCKHFFEVKIKELMILIRIYYPNEQLCQFFYAILNPDNKFAEFVRVNHLKYQTVQEMAAALHLTVKQFSTRFKKVFDQPPYEWMKAKKERVIYDEICMTDKPLKQIAMEYGITSSGNFTNYCKAAFGKTGEQIRNKNKGPE